MRTALLRKYLRNPERDRKKDSDFPQRSFSLNEASWSSIRLFDLLRPLRERERERFRKKRDRESSRSIARIRARLTRKDIGRRAS